MNRVLLTVGTIGLVIAGATAANAQGYGRGSVIDARQDRQAQRIVSGIRNGSLTRREASELIAQQRRISAYEHHAKSDGRLDRVERARLTHMQNRASRHIFAEKHDLQNRAPWWRRIWVRRWH